MRTVRFEKGVEIVDLDVLYDIKAIMVTEQSSDCSNVGDTVVYVGFNKVSYEVLEDCIMITSIE